MTMKKSFIFLAVTFLINILSLYYRWYLTYPWSDQILHLLGGFFMAMFMSQYLKEHLFYRCRLKNFLIILGAVSFIGVIWEFSEYIANLVISPILYGHYGIKTYFIGNLDDTLNDLLMDILGAGLFAILLNLSRTKFTADRH